MRDGQTGAGGFSLGFIALATTAVGIAAINQGTVVQALIASEASAKFAMVFQAAMGKPAHRGMSTPFVKAMHERYRCSRFGLAFGLQLVISVAMLQIVGVVLTVSAVAVAAAMLAISMRTLGGVTGDVMGATNDLTRLVSFLVIVVGAR
jgi:adenosylcobinamide-GDP ribazoletransferase